VGRSNAARQITRSKDHQIRSKDHQITRSSASEIATSLDRLLHDRMRLGIVSALAAADQMSFSDLKASLNATDGNLSVHARKLEEANYVTCNKSFEGRVPRTSYTLTSQGRRAPEKYLDHMEALIRATRDR
jgi:DNA-binding transcriptional ArsR family regulator